MGGCFIVSFLLLCVSFVCGVHFRWEFGREMFEVLCVFVFSSGVGLLIVTFFLEFFLCVLFIAWIDVVLFVCCYMENVCFDDCCFV